MTGARSAPLVAAIAALAGAEVLVALEHVLAAQIVDGVMLVLLVNARQAAMRALALVALIGVVGPGLPLEDVSAPAAEALIAAGIALAAFKAAPAVGVPRGVLVSMPPLPALAAAGAAGVALGYAAYRLGAPALASHDDPLGRICLAVVAAAATAVVEELVFRGLVQASLQRLAAGAGALAATALFACTYLSAGRASLIVLVTLAGLVFAYSFARSGALGGAALAHVLFACGAVVAWPLILGPAPAAPPPTPALLASTAVALVGAILLARGPVAPLAGAPAIDAAHEAQARMRNTSPSRPR